MAKELSGDEIESTYEMIRTYWNKHLRQHGIKMPRLRGTRGFTKDALILIYLAQGYPKTRKVSMESL